MESIGYAIDFKEIKRVGLQWIDDYMDHCFIANPHDTVIIDAAKATGNGGNAAGGRGGSGIVIIRFKNSEINGKNDKDHADNDHDKDHDNDDSRDYKPVYSGGLNNVAKLCATSKNNIVIGHSSKVNLFKFKNNTYEYSKSITPN
jgi:hypothetical protein